MLEWLQMMKLAAGQSDHQCCFFLFFKALLITGSGKLFVTFVKVLLETQRLAGAAVLARGMCEYAKLPENFFPLFCPCEVSTWKREIVWKPFALQGLHGEKPHRAELCKNVWCRFLSWAYATFCFREAVFVRWPFSQSCNSGHGEEGLVRDSICPALCEHYDMHDLAKSTR